MTLESIDRGVAVLLGVVCAAVVLTGWSMRGDAGIFPVIAGSLGFLACVALGVGTWRRAPEVSPAPLDAHRLRLWCLCVLGLLLLITPLGTFVALPLFLLASVRLLARLRWLSAVLIAVGFTAMIYLIFDRLLAVPLPSGWLAPWLEG